MSVPYITGDNIRFMGDAISTPERALVEIEDDSAWGMMGIVLGCMNYATLGGDKDPSRVRIELMKGSRAIQILKSTFGEAPDIFTHEA